MKASKAQTQAAYHRIPNLSFEQDGRLTRFGGLPLIQSLFVCLKLKERLRPCFRHLGKQFVFAPVNFFVLLLVHIMLGFRSLRDLDYYRDDPLIPRVTGFRFLPSVSTASRYLSKMDEKAATNLRELLGQLTVERIMEAQLPRVTLDFDGTVQSTRGHAEGTAIGYNKKRKGDRSYYPLLCSIAQTGQYLNVLHRPGNVHDSNGAVDFMQTCLAQVCDANPSMHLEVRSDSAFFSEEIFALLHLHKTEFACSIPFERLPELKEKIEQRKRWHKSNDKESYFEIEWSPKKWTISYRLIFIRQKKPVRHKGPLQLDLFEPRDYDYEYSVIATNKRQSAPAVIAFHHGRGTMEKTIGETKQHAAFEVLPSRRRFGNIVFMLASLMAHNFSREMQMINQAPTRPTQRKRPPRWHFCDLGTLQRKLFHRAAVVTRPQGELTLSISATPEIAEEVSEFMERMQAERMQAERMQAERMQAA